MRRDLHSTVKRLESMVYARQGRDDDQFFEFEGGERVPILTDDQARARGLTRCVTVDEWIRYELDPHVELEGEYITPELLAFLEEATEEAKELFKDDVEYQRALKELDAALAMTDSPRERRKLIAEFHKRYSACPPRMREEP